MAIASPSPWFSFQAPQGTDTAAPHVLVLAPVRISGRPDGEPTAMILNEVNSGGGDGAVVDMPHVTIEVPADRILEESRAMAQAILADHHYEVAMKTFSRQPRMLSHNGLTVMVYDVDLRDDDRHRINYGELLVDWTIRYPVSSAPYLHHNRDWPDDVKFTALQVHSGPVE